MVVFTRKHGPGSSDGRPEERAKNTAKYKPHSSITPPSPSNSLHANPEDRGDHLPPNQISNDCTTRFVDA
jgi:hypothetical protein